MFHTLNGYVAVKQDVEKVSNVISAGEVRRGTGVVKYEEPETPPEFSFLGVRLYFRLEDTIKVTIDKEDLLVVSLEKVFGGEFES
jgi:hypothetical protein